MKKFVIVVLIVLLGAAGWAAATHVIGGQVEKRYFSTLDQVEQWGPVQVTSQSYERGFLASRARTVLEFKVPDTSAGPKEEVEEKSIRLTFEHALRHGPLPAGTTPDGGFSLAPMLALVETRLVDVSLGDQSFEKTLAEIPPVRDSYAFSTIGLAGGTRSRLMIPAFEKTIGEEQVTVSWGGLTCDAQLSRNMETVSGNLSLPSLQIQMEDGQLLWDGISARFDLNEAFAMVYLGSSEVHFGTMRLAFPDSQKGRREIVLKGLDISSEGTREGSTANYLQSVNISEVTVDDDTYGPGLVEVAARRLDGEALSRYQTSILEIYREETFDPEQIGIRVLQIYTQLLADLSKGSPEIEFSRLQFSTPMGEFDGKVRVTLHGEEGLVLGDMTSLMKSLEAEADVRVDEQLVRSMLIANFEQKMKAARDQGDFPEVSDEKINELAVLQVDGQLASMAQQNFLVRDNGKLSSQATFNRGELIVNGRQLMAQAP